MRRTLIAARGALAVWLLTFMLPGLAAQEPTTDPEPEAGATAAPAEADDPLDDVRDMVREGNYPAAADRLGSLVDDETADAGLLTMYGEVLVATARIDDAIPILERAIAADPERPRLHFQLATAYSQRGRVEEALTAYETELEINDEPQVQFMARLNRSILLKQKRHWPEAAAEIERALAVEPEHPEFYGELVTLYLKGDDADAALRSLQAGASAGFESANLYFNVGAHLYNAKRFVEAEKTFRRALELHADMAEAERSLGSTLTQLDRADEATAHFKRYLELRPDAPDAKEIQKHIESAGN